MSLKIKKYNFTSKTVKTIPDEAGVYIFWSKDKPLYVGKSVNLRSRIRSYGSQRLYGKTSKMISLADKISFIKVTSEIEALLLEAKLVSILKTPYNIQLKDDKHPLYIRITGDEYPLVLTARKANINDSDKAVFGPFPSSASVRKTLFLLRRVFPYSQHPPGKRACIYSQMQLCKPCPSDIENTKDPALKSQKKKYYAKNISYIIKFLRGKPDAVVKSLTKEMLSKIKTEAFEDANTIKEKISAIEYITSPKNPTTSFLKNPNFSEDIKEKELKSLNKDLSRYIKISKLVRIECFDVAHLFGSFPTASMITFINGSPDKSYYRHFKISGVRPNDDVSSLGQVAERRRKHFADWGRPDLIIVDGGKGQVSVFEKEMAKTKIPIIGIAKRTETLIIPQKDNGKRSFILLKLKQGPSLNLTQRLRNEAHRFARRLHHKLVEKALFQNK